MLATRGALDFDDLVVGAADALESRCRASPSLAVRASGTSASTSSRTWTPPSCAWSGCWRSRSATCSWLATTTRRSTRGDWPTCGGSSSFESLYPGARRVQLATNYRCPAHGRRCLARLIGVNRERFEKRDRRRAGRDRWTADADRGMPSTRRRTGRSGWRRWPPTEAAAGERVCFLARTRAELGPIAAGAGARRNRRTPPRSPPPVQAEPVPAPDRRRPAGLPGHSSISRLLTLRVWPRLATVRRQRSAVPTTTMPRSTRCSAGRWACRAWTASWRRTTGRPARLGAAAARCAGRAGHRAWRQGSGVADGRGARDGGGALPEPPGAARTRPIRHVRWRRSDASPTWR